MERTCARAVELGLTAISFTEHSDPDAGWAVLASDLEDYPYLSGFVEARTDPGGPTVRILRPPALDVRGYFDCLERCRHAFPELRLLSGVEIGEPHRHPQAVKRLLSEGPFERVIGSLHSFPFRGVVSEMPNLFRQLPPGEVVRAYLAELVKLIEGSEVFSVLGHIDYVLRYWPENAEPFDVHAFEDEFRHALRALAITGRALEINTRRRLEPEVVHWWRDEEGTSVTFGSDAHDERELARGLDAAHAMVEAIGFRPGAHPHNMWTRTS